MCIANVFLYIQCFLFIPAKENMNDSWSYVCSENCLNYKSNNCSFLRSCYCPFLWRVTLYMHTLCSSTQANPRADSLKLSVWFFPLSNSSFLHLPKIESLSPQLREIGGLVWIPPLYHSLEITIWSKAWLKVGLTSLSAFSQEL